LSEKNPPDSQASCHSLTLESLGHAIGSEPFQLTRVTSSATIRQPRRLNAGERGFSDSGRPANRDSRSIGRSHGGRVEGQLAALVNERSPRAFVQEQFRRCPVSARCHCNVDPRSAPDQIGCNPRNAEKQRARQRVRMRPDYHRPGKFRGQVCQFADNRAGHARNGAVKRHDLAGADSHWTRTSR